MPGEAVAVGAVAKVVNTIASWFMSKGGFAEYRKRNALAAKKKETIIALRDHDYKKVRVLVAELERMSSKL